MPDLSETDRERLQLLMELATLQAKRKRLLGQVNKLNSPIQVLVNKLRQRGVTPKTISELTDVPLSTIYSNSRYPIHDKEGGEPE